MTINHSKFIFIIILTINTLHGSSIQINKKTPTIFKNIIFDLMDVIIQRDEKNNLVEIPDGVRLIKILKESGYKIFALSNCGKKTYQEALEKCTVLSMFDGTVFSFQEGIAKPNPKIYERIMQKYCLIASESIFIDDNSTNVRSAKNVGLTGIVCTTHTHVQQELIRLNVLQQQKNMPTSSLKNKKKANNHD